VHPENNQGRYRLDKNFRNRYITQLNKGGSIHLCVQKALMMRQDNPRTNATKSKAIKMAKSSKGKRTQARRSKIARMSKGKRS
jgi:hypothetical protein